MLSGRAGKVVESDEVLEPDLSGWDWLYTKALERRRIGVAGTAGLYISDRSRSGGRARLGGRANQGAPENLWQQIF